MDRAEIVEAKKSGRLAGKSEMTILLTGIQINNQVKPISTTAPPPRNALVGKHLREELPFMATENILMEAVAGGGDR